MLPLVCCFKRRKYIMVMTNNRHIAYVQNRLIDQVLVYHYILWSIWRSQLTVIYGFTTTEFTHLFRITIGNPNLIREFIVTPASIAGSWRNIVLLSWEIRAVVTAFVEGSSFNYFWVSISVWMHATIWAAWHFNCGCIVQASPLLFCGRDALAQYTQTYS